MEFVPHRNRLIKIYWKLHKKNKNGFYINHKIYRALIQFYTKDDSTDIQPTWYWRRGKCTVFQCSFSNHEEVQHERVSRKFQTNIWIRRRKSEGAFSVIFQKLMKEGSNGFEGVFFYYFWLFFKRLTQVICVLFFSESLQKIIRVV